MDDLSGLIWASSGQKQPGMNGMKTPSLNQQAPLNSLGNNSAGYGSGLAGSRPMNGSSPMGIQSMPSNNNSNGGGFGGPTSFTPRSSIPSQQPSLSVFGGGAPSNSSSNSLRKESADAFGNLVSFGSAAKVDVSKLSLSEQAQYQQQKTLSSTTQSPSALGLSPISPKQQQSGSSSSTATSFPAGAMATTISPSTPNSASRNGSNSINGFAGLASASSSSPSPQLQSVKTSPSAPQNQWNFDAMFSTGSAAPSAAAQPATVAASMAPAAAQGNDDLFDFLSAPVVKPVAQAAPAPQNDDFSIFSSKPVVASDAQATVSSAPIQLQQQQQQSSSSSVKETRASAPVQTPSAKKEPTFDENLARLVDIGFDADDARRALDETNNVFDAAVEAILHDKRGNSSKQKPSAGDVSARISKMTGLSAKNAEKAGQLLNTASEVGFGLFNKAKMLVAESSKKISTVMDERARRAPASSDFRRGSDGSFDIPDGRMRMSSNTNSPRTSQRGSRESLHSIEAVAPAQPKPIRKQRTSAPVSCAPDVLAKSNQLKELGNAFFKQGQYGDAEEKYTQAINFLPQNHLALIALLNNRAGARLKTGNYKECVVDCSTVESLCLAEIEYEDVDVAAVQDYKDSISKALLRRGTAFENIEKWEEAKQDYRRSLSLNPNAKGANEGLRRCNRATDPSMKAVLEKEAAGMTSNGDGLLDAFGGSSNKPMAPSQAPASNPLHDLSFMTVAPAPHENAPPADFKSERVDALRAQDAQKSIDDEEKIRVKDGVDLALMNWKRGKEANIRALIASLELVLWPAMKSDWKPVNMSELVTPAQVKVRYMKAIAKLHPDKLSNTPMSVEEKLLANGIFSSLNDAWDAFKTYNLK